MRIRLSPNRVIKFLIWSDLAFWSGWGLLTPVFAIFVVNKIEGGSAFVVGIASAVFWIARSLFRVPIGLFLDKCPSEKDDYFSLVSGFFVVSLVPFGYVFAKTPPHIYLLQALHGIGLAMSMAGWSAIFTRHLDKGRESTEWGLDATSIGLGMGITGAIGGWAVSRFGFEPVFIAVGALSMLGAILLLGLRSDIKGVFDNGFHISLRDIFHIEKR